MDIDGDMVDSQGVPRFLKGRRRLYYILLTKGSPERSMVAMILKPTQRIVLMNVKKVLVGRYVAS